ncbi:MAG: hypothetical protein U0793_25850 [Gemmataceae bacterium]
MNGPYLSAAQRQLLNQQQAQVPAPLRSAFAAAFHAWQETWSSHALSSDSRAVASGKEFDALRALGPAILPLLIEKLADPENFFALPLYDVMHADQGLVQDEPDHERIFEGEQARARRAVADWFANR